MSIKTQHEYLVKFIDKNGQAHEATFSSDRNINEIPDEEIIERINPIPIKIISVTPKK
jgi:hypothetical protein